MATYAIMAWLLERNQFSSEWIQNPLHDGVKINAWTVSLANNQGLGK